MGPPRRAKKGSQDSVDRGGWLRALRRDDFTCQLCGSHRSLEVHHIRRRSRGGEDSPSNLLTVCHDCHARIHAGLVSAGPRAGEPSHG